MGRSGDEKTAAVLSFREAALRVGRRRARHRPVFRERKLRLLNGTHGWYGTGAFVGFYDGSRRHGIRRNGSVYPKSDAGRNCTCYPPLPPGDATTFGLQVLNRFRNPFFQHKWLEYSRTVFCKNADAMIPLLLKHYRKKTEPPQRMALGFAAYCVFSGSPPGK